jgi:hypothetical protein
MTAPFLIVQFPIDPPLEGEGRLELSNAKHKPGWGEQDDNNVDSTLSHEEPRANTTR